jgi:hypothetical protein
MSTDNQISEEIEIKTVGSSVFGRYPKINIEYTANLIISDDWLVNYAGFLNVFAQNSTTKRPNSQTSTGVGRGCYRSTRLNQVLAVISNGVYLIDKNLNPNLIGKIDTFSGDVFIAEDIQGHLAICDKSDIYIYTEATGVFTTATVDGTNPLDFTPGYVCYQNGRFISVDLDTSEWRLSNPGAANPNTIFPFESQFVGAFQTKADNPQAALPMPGKSNMLIILGKNSGELWMDLGLALFPYQKQSGTSIDYGTLSSDTIATSNDIAVWLAGNEKSGPFIAYTTGGLPEQISTDGINFKLGNLNNPEDSHAFLFRQDGHLIYQITFVKDNLSLIYDFTTKKFFNVSDEFENYHPAKKTVYFNTTYYFVSLNDGGFYEFDSRLTTYNYGYDSQGNYNEAEIPRIRVTDTTRDPDTSQRIYNSLVIPFEQGTQNDIPKCDLSVSRDGGMTFGNFDRMNFHANGSYRNLFKYFGLGMSNEFTLQIRFYSSGRFVMGKGLVNSYK